LSEDGLFRGVYSAERAAALSGVPKSTVYYWARHDVWSPSLRHRRPKLWTYADILALRIIYWLRHGKKSWPDQLEVRELSTTIGEATHPGPRKRATRSSSMEQVRKALESIRTQGQEIWSEDVSIFVDRGGHVFFETATAVISGRRVGQTAMPNVLELLAEFPSEAGVIGPDLKRPRPGLRIIPGKLAGEPHVAGTRIASKRVAALVKDGLNVGQVVDLYPDLSASAVGECVDLEQQLQSNVA